MITQPALTPAQQYALTELDNVWYGRASNGMMAYRKQQLDEIGCWARRCWNGGVSDTTLNVLLRLGLAERQGGTKGYNSQWRITEAGREAAKAVQNAR